MQIITQSLSGIDIGQPITSGRLTMVPLFNGNKGEADYFTLDDALAHGLVKITEVSASGTVPELKLVNRGERPVLLVDGEELVGAKQNRILNLTILVPARAELKIPVSCVERGRWHPVTDAFTTASRTQFVGGRARKTEDVTFSLKRTGRADSDQRKTWIGIDDLLRNLQVQSTTCAMADAYDSYSDHLDRSVRALSAVEAQAGAVFAIDHQIAGLDLFDHSSTFGKLLPKLIRSYGLESLAYGPKADGTEPLCNGAVHQFLDSIIEAETQSFEAIGEGEDIRIQKADLAAAALVARGRLIHLCGFRINKDQ